MKVIDAVQGSDEWHSARAKHNTASEASSMMGVGKTSRNDLIRLKATGDDKEFSRFTEEVVFAEGHRVEAAARPRAELIIGEELYPVTATDDDGYLLASFDGITMLEDAIWECKQWNEEKAELVRAGDVPTEDYWQVVQQLAVSGAEKCVYMVTDGADRCETVEVPYSQTDVDKLLSGWKQFDKDVTDYVPRETAPEAVGRSPESLPALRIEVSGGVTSSNLDAFRDHALAVFQGINTDLKTDEDFASADKTTKWCKDVEGKLDAAKEAALAQTASIEDLFRSIDAIKDEARAKRLELEKLVKARKESIRSEIITAAREAFRAHVDKLAADVLIAIPVAVPDFALAIKGKRTISSLHDATDTLLAQSKITANELADLIRSNMKLIDATGEHRGLFADTASLVVREADFVKATISNRIAEHKEAERVRLERDRERIRSEEEAKARAEAERVQAAKDAEAAQADTAPPKVEQKAIVEVDQASTDGDREPVSVTCVFKTSAHPLTPDSDIEAKIRKALLNAGITSLHSVHIVRTAQEIAAWATTTRISRSLI